MDLSIFLGVIGIIVSIAVGFGTFYLAEKRARRNRWQSAKETVLRDLSKSLGEGNIPATPVILATIRSVLRSQNASDLSSVTLDEIADDLLRQITSDPFLDAERRKQLQSEVLSLKESQAKMEEAKAPEEKKAEMAMELRKPVLSWSSILSAMAGLITTLIVAFGMTSIDRLIDWLREVFRIERMFTIVPAIAAVLTVLAIAIYTTIMTMRSNRKDK